jgi:hypothetical protein
MLAQTSIETISIPRDSFIDQIKRRIYAGEVRRLMLKQGSQTIAEFSTPAGVGALATSILSAVSALAATLSDCRIEVEYRSSTLDAEPEATAINWIGVEPVPADA